jgi:hypothetical protein
MDDVCRICAGLGYYADSRGQHPCKCAAAQNGLRNLDTFAAKVGFILSQAAGHPDNWTKYDRNVMDLAEAADAEIERLKYDAAMRPTTVPTECVVVPKECSTEMAHAMSRLDGWDRDRDMPGLQKWTDYWDAAVAAHAAQATG